MPEGPRHRHGTGIRIFTPSGQGARVRARAASGAGHRAPASERNRGLGRSPSWIDGKRAGRIAFDASVRMKIHEYQAKSILARHGVPVPRGEVAFNAVE